MFRKLFTVSLIALFAACGPPKTTVPDSGEPEAQEDAGQQDAGAPDAGEPDAGERDAGVIDAGAPDASIADAGDLDAGEPDASILDTFILSAPPALTNDTDAGFAFNSTEPFATFECSLDSAAWSSCTSPWGYSALTEGAHGFSVRSIEPDGGVDTSPADASWTIDLTPPETTLLTAPSGDASTNSATFTFSSEAGAAFECSLDGAAFTPCASGIAYSGLDSGAHTFEVRAKDLALNVDPTPATAVWNVLPGNTLLRIVSANTTSGNLQSYDPGEGIRMFQGLHPDVVLIQEFNYGSNTDNDLRTFMNVAFPPGYSYYRQPGSLQIPNGVISRYPIIASGTWDDVAVSNRDFAWARIDLPGPKDLWAVSVHLLTSSGTSRASETSALATFINANVPAGDFLTVGGDFNTGTRTETCVTNLSSLLVTQAPFPADQSGNDNTSANRSKPYDWVLVDGDLNAFKTPVTIGAATFDGGLVFDSRVYTPLTDVSPVIQSDSAATNMQHMPVVKDFLVPY